MKILITTSTLPVSDDDKVPAFVKDQAIELKKARPGIDLLIHAPHNYHSRTTSVKLGTQYYREKRFHYFWPFQWELLAGRGIVPALQKNKILYLQIPFLFVFQFFSLLRTVRREKPDLIYAHWFTPQAINCALVTKFTGTPFVFTSHASDVSVLKSVPFSKKLIRWTCTKAVAFTAVSERTANRLKYFFDVTDWQKNFAGKLHIIPMGVFLSSPNLSKSEVNKVLKEYKLPLDKQLVFYIGRLSEIKGIEYLIDAFALLAPAERQKFHLVIAGDGLTKDDLIKRVKLVDLKNVTFTGYVSGTNKDALFQAADVVCVPSIVDSKGHMEGMPVSLMEGLAEGKIVMASNVSGAEAILTDGKDGFLFEQKSGESLKAALLKVSSLDSKKRTSVQAESRKLAHQFDWDTITEKHYQIFKKAVKN